jgi:N-acetylmuramoyl-L-alanine amidase
MIKIRKFSSNYIWLLDNGHGGLIDGVYQTQGKRSPKLPDGRVLYEGVYNRLVVSKLIERLEANCISYCNLVPENEDIKLYERCNRANKIHTKVGGKTVYVSIHANAFGNEFNDANGIESYYFSKNGKSSKSGIALAKIFQKHLIKQSQRRDRGIKGANFYVLRHTAMPSLLTESPFMTNYEEAKLMLTDEFQDTIALAHFNAIMEIEKNKILG